MRTCTRTALSVGTVVAFLAACNGSQPSIATPNAVPHNRALDTKSCPCLYVANVDLGGRVTVYPLGASGNIKPIQQIAGSKTHLGHPHGIAVDASGKIYVSNIAPASVTVYAAVATGNSKPIAIISGPHTGLSYPLGLAIDPVNGDIYTANGGGGPQKKGAVAIYAPGSNGDVSPSGVIQGRKTQLDYPHYVALDADQNVEVTNADNSMTFYRARATGDVAPTRIIAGARTKIKDPIELTVDSGLNTYVANWADNRVTVFAPGANGNAAPIRDIQGYRTSLDGAVGVAVDSDGNVYAGSGQFVNTSVITVYAPGSTGNARPIRKIEGANTGLAFPNGVTIH